MEFSVAGTALVGLSPLLIGIAAAIRLTSDGPAIFRQKRVGATGEDFTILKFRTMLLNDEEGSARSIADDHRITRLGRILRRHKLDELPQLINVVRGDMGLVGPRPMLREHHAIDLHLRPGVTGAASVAFAAEDILIRHIPHAHLEECHRSLINPRKLELDLHYVATATFATDIRLLCMTLLRWGRYKQLSQIGEWPVALYIPHGVLRLATLHASAKYPIQHLQPPAFGQTEFGQTDSGRKAHQEAESGKQHLRPPNQTGRRV